MTLTNEMASLSVASRINEVQILTESSLGHQSSTLLLPSLSMKNLLRSLLLFLSIVTIGSCTDYDYISQCENISGSTTLERENGCHLCCQANGYGTGTYSEGGKGCGCIE